MQIISEIKTQQIQNKCEELEIKIALFKQNILKKKDIHVKYAGQFHHTQWSYPARVELPQVEDTRGLKKQNS